MFTEPLLGARCPARYWGHNCEDHRSGPSFHGASVWWGWEIAANGPAPITQKYVKYLWGAQHGIKCCPQLFHWILTMVRQGKNNDLHVTEEETGAQKV